MKETLKLTILTPQRKVFDGEVKEFATENELGRLEILPKHITMITATSPTVTSFTTLEDKKLKIFTSTGLVKIDNNVINMLTETAEWPEEIDISRAEGARNKAVNLIKAKKEIEHQKAELKLKRAVARIKAKR